MKMNLSIFQHLIGNPAKICLKWLGKTKYTLAEYETIKRFSFYLGDDYLLFVSAEKDCDTNFVVDQVIKLYYENQE